MAVSEPAFNIGAVFRPTILLALSLMAVIAMMILPMPAWLLDLGLAASFALAILIFTVTLFIERPLDFSAFPTVLLASLVLRLSLNVSSTKLIIGQGHTGTNAAGDVIEGFANFVMGGSIFLGLVVFGVLLIVNFVVITKGAARMAEVGARFALDGMPGRQLAIDSDMSAGAIDHDEAHARRERELAETTFFGSLDGASKFVKGDAVAGLLITLLNLVMGLVIGIVVHEMPVVRAFETYAILTVGDGLVSQIPAVIISIASAILLSRGGSKGSADLAIFSQLGRYPSALFTVALLMGLFAFVPGLPFLPFILGSSGLAMAGFALSRRLEDVGNAETPDTIEATPEPSLGDVIDLDDIHVEFAPDLVPMVLDPATGLDARIGNMRQHIAAGFGVILPEIRLTDDPSLLPGSYVVRIQGVVQARDRVSPGHVLMLIPKDEGELPVGEDVLEPVYAAPARWISPDASDSAALGGATVVTPTEVLATHLLEIIKSNLSRLLTHKGLRRLLDEVTRLGDRSRAEANKRMLDELVPDRVPFDLLLAVLRHLLSERVSVRNLQLILETIAEAHPGMGQAESIAEFVRQRLGFQIVADLVRADGTLPLVQLAPEWEPVFEEHQIEGPAGSVDVALPPDAFNHLATSIATKVRQLGDMGEHPAMITSVRRRRFLRTVLQAKGLANPVLSFEEIGTDTKPALLGMIPA
ncbi:MAG: flagellar biosynthesis protein FlhA [Pseudomonadota bacterium]